MVRAAPEEGQGSSSCPARTSLAPPGRDRGGVTGQHVLIPIQLGRVGGVLGSSSEQQVVGLGQKGFLSGTSCRSVYKGHAEPDSRGCLHSSPSLSLSPTNWDVHVLLPQGVREGC